MCVCVCLSVSLPPSIHPSIAPSQPQSLPLGSHHDHVENGSSDHAYDQEQRGAGIVVNDDDEDDYAEDEDDNGQEEWHTDRTLSIGLAHAQIQQARQRHALLIFKED